MNRIAAVAFITVLSFLGCATTTELTATQEAYLAEAMATPLSFTLPTDQAEKAWSRGRSFVERFGAMRLQNLTPHVIRTYDPAGPMASFGYYLRKIPKGDRTEFTVECICQNMSVSDASLQNAHLLAYYMKTGNLDPALVNR